MTGVSLLLLGIAAVAVLLVLVIWAKVPAFVALIGVSIATAIASGIPLADSVSTVTNGVGKTLGSVAVVVGLGAMLGRIIEVSGGAEAVARYFTDKLGRHRVTAAVTIAAFILGIPVFFDVGFIILAPIVFGFAAVAKINPLKIGLPVAGAILTVHVTLPPHPGPVAVAGIFSSDPGLMLTLGLPIAALTCVIGYYAAKVLKLDSIDRGPSPVELSDAAPNHQAPSPFAVLGLILLPIVLIMVGATGAMYTEKGTVVHSLVSFIGSSPVALLVAVVVAWLSIGKQQSWNREHSSGVLDSALPAVAIIIFVTGAGGGFANVLVESGIGKVLSDMLVAAHMPLILMAFLLSLALRASQGSATVAMLTTAGLLTQPIAEAGLSSVRTTLVMIAIGFGAMCLSHINDSGFWIVTKYLGLSVKQGLRTWTLLSTAFGVAGFALTSLVYAVV